MITECGVNQRISLVPFIRNTVEYFVLNGFLSPSLSITRHSDYSVHILECSKIFR